ncbi:hypothetical protein ACH5RR_029425 [Cinchona calisaya]|uniref:Uncharacterized protein n=1 Tax=Cinchona calisaya TaxID=153742 RepID=A0ABD2YUZ6_9GENT
MSWWLNIRPTSVERVLCKLIPTNVSWNLWKGRNKMVFDSAMANSTHIIHAFLAAIKSISLAYPLSVKDTCDHHLLMTDYIAPSLHIRPPRVVSCLESSCSRLVQIKLGRCR